MRSAIDEKHQSILRAEDFADPGQLLAEPAHRASEIPFFPDSSACRLEERAEPESNGGSACARRQPSRPSWTCHHIRIENLEGEILLVLEVMIKEPFGVLVSSSSA